MFLWTYVLTFPFSFVLDACKNVCQRLLEVKMMKK